MKTFDIELEKVVLPYLDRPELSTQQKDRIWKQMAFNAPLPLLARWVLYRSLRSTSSWI